MGFPTWDAATACTSGPQPGALALMKWIIEHYGDEGAMNWGIYNCRSVRGAATTSTHGEGRALDVGFAVGDRDGDRLLRKLLKYPGRLGIQCIIYERKIYSRKSPEGRYYGGVAPHYDHLHIELTREAAQKLTYRTVKTILSPKVHRPGTRDLRKGMRGADVKYVQRKIGIKDDGIFGQKTKEAVRKYERQQKKKFPKLQVDGVVGKLTWRIMGIVPKY